MKGIWGQEKSGEYKIGANWLFPPLIPIIY